MQLSRETITAAAFNILGEYGLGDVSMRRVATALGVAPGALYWHIENKQDLIASLAAEIVRPLSTGTDATDATGTANVATLAAALRTQVLSVRDGAEVVLAALSQPDAPVREELIAVFVAQVRAEWGDAASASVARAAAANLVYMTLGAAMVYQAGAQLAALTGEPPAVSAADAAREHAEGVALLLAGLRTPSGPTELD
ncbi:TetR/AcrR family transcriptional regulator [Corynebacterium sp. p3-SID1056]|uniref:TetR/AcrR family transcriptional regulator n=1 Tax=Corynebacterium sp. p3-SID1056 TaxID=2916092 RepID=UPI0021A4C88A|nr:TetR family transcriptional regulator [Corynebacterium sp. p3-SID1056]MCT2337895.1 TetR family transcriptional regulator [Corynebacterium sp. p3-SID1056]